MTASRPAFFPQSEIECAAANFANGVLAAMVAPREFYQISQPDRHLDSYERARHCDSEIARIQREDKLAALDRCLALIAARRDILDLMAAA